MSTVVIALSSHPQPTKKNLLNKHYSLLVTEEEGETWGVYQNNFYSYVKCRPIFKGRNTDCIHYIFIISNFCLSGPHFHCTNQKHEVLKI